jgi:Coenzyme Q (ubiquinone) biosynthesis protein Coq4
MKTFYQKLHTYREAILSKIVGFLNPIYKAVMPRNRAWKLTKDHLSLFPKGSLGRDLSEFMESHNFDMLPYLETHDIYHVLLGYKPDIVDEARLYFFLLGNGKYSLEVLATVWVSLWLLPDYWGDLYNHFQRGADSHSIAKWDFRYLMHEDTQILRGIIFQQHEAKFYV